MNIQNIESQIKLIQIELGILQENKAEHKVCLFPSGKTIGITEKRHLSIEDNLYPKTFPFTVANKISNRIKDAMGEYPDVVELQHFYQQKLEQLQQQLMYF